MKTSTEYLSTEITKTYESQVDYSQPIVIRPALLNAVATVVAVKGLELVDSDTHEAWNGPIVALEAGRGIFASGVSGCAPGSNTTLNLLAVGTRDYDGTGHDENGLRWSLHYFPRAAISPFRVVRSRNLALKGFRDSLTAVKAELPEFIRAVVAGCVIGCALLVDGGAL
jgi:hypothetical protein